MTRRIRMGLAAALCAAGVAACSGSNGFTEPGFGTGGSVGQPNSQVGSITGSVTADGRGVGGIAVLVANGDSTRTDGTGRYTLGNLGPATYSLTLRIPINYTLAPGEQNPRNVTVGAGQTASVNWQLRETTTVP